MTPRRRQILDTAADLFAARGFHGVSVGDIGAAVGISGPALYKHFTGKEDILGQCLLHASERLLEGARALAGAEPGRDGGGRPGAVRDDDGSAGDGSGSGSNASNAVRGDRDRDDHRDGTDVVREGSDARATSEISGTSDSWERSGTDVAREGRSRTGDGPGDALDALIAFHTDFALSQPSLIVIQEREWGSLGDRAQAQVRERQLAYIEVWTRALRPHRPDLSPAQARAAVQAAFGLLNSTPHSARISRSAMRGLLTRMARAALAP
ncbi:TetR/AcrR family transcriptional regulator [Myceligenerans xiligouense]|uniref:TetR family transcriptional regulator n=1 Tax=Myceligenerans xiligouense TaxID=253184 RepID=A0A3N4Z6G3_9MICO|nr:TetR family transcriptional regulator [Myceligenerans xiligouense]